MPLITGLKAAIERRHGDQVRQEETLRPERL